MKMKLLFLLILLILLNKNLFLQEMPDCWCVPQYNLWDNHTMNFDSSFAFDTCDIQEPSINCDSIFYLNYHSYLDAVTRLNAKELWGVWFDVKAFPLPYYNKDTLIILTWQNIDSLNFPSIKDSLELMANTYGNYYFEKVHPDLIDPIYGQLFFVYFDDYVNVIEIMNKFRDIPFTHCDFEGGLSHTTAEVFENKNNNYNVTISPNPTSGQIKLAFIDKKLNHKIRLYNSTGILINEYNIHSNRKELDLSQFPNGIYFLQIGNEFQKIVVIK